MIVRMLAIPKTAFCIYQPVNHDTQLSKFQSKNFSDSVKLTVISGSGGNGCISYFTDKRIRKGQPDGGCGGKGGDIVIEAHSSLYDLSHLRRRTIEGNNGGKGGPRGKDGKNGGKTIIRVPCGTLISEIEINQDQATFQNIERKNFIADLERNLSQQLIAKGGSMGKGNKRHPFMNESSRFGMEGQKKIIHLELKTLADIGLVGFPNIGKSTFLAAASRALPKIANYQFTTLKPSVGYVKFVDDFQMTVADIPGIIENAHLNKGLGLEFLRHIERTQLLIFMLDITLPSPLDQLRKLLHELSQYDSKKFSQKNKLIVFNKMDCRLDSQQIFEQLAGTIGERSFLISAKEGTNVGQVLIEARKIIEEIRKSKEKEEEKIAYKYV